MSEHGFGIALVMANTYTRVWHDTVVYADLICFFEGKVKFEHPTKTVTQGHPYPCALVAWGVSNANAVEKSGLGWCVPGTVGL